MKKFSILTAFLVITQITGLCAEASAQSKKQVHMSVTNKTDQTIIIAARYAVLPQKDPNLMGMPNPFIFVEVPAQETVRADFNCTGGGRLGNLEEIVVRTQDHYAFKTLDKKALAALKAKDSVMITIDKDMLPKK